MDAKIPLLLFMIFAGVPAAVVLMRASPLVVKAVLFMTIFLIPFVYYASMGLFVMEKYYRGTSIGFEIFGAYLPALCIIGFLLLSGGKKRFVFFPPGAKFYILYFLLSVISLINSEVLMYSYYELFKMTMMYVFFISIYNWFMLYKDFSLILFAFACVLILNMIIMLTQHYLFGYYQATGLFPHQNSTAIFSNIISPVFLSYFLNVKLPRKKFWFYVFAYGAGAVSVVLTLSRGALFFFPIAAFVVVALSLLNGIDGRKMRIVLAMGLVALAGVIKAAPMVVDRFVNAPESSGQGRVGLAECALNMAEDKFFGVGLNNWGVKINPPYTYDQGTSFKRDKPKGAIVETIYLLVAAECGWIGLVSLLLWFGYYYLQCFLNTRRYKSTSLFYIPVGILGGLSAAFGQSVLEWVLKQPVAMFQLMTIFAVIAAMYTIYKNAKAAARAKRRAALLKGKAK